MKKTFLFILSFLFLTSLVLGDELLSNGDFEIWTAGAPDDWTLIDSGITVTEETSTIHGGLSGANIDVTTGSQASTDFRQSVDVTNGTTYSISVWVYHTEGTMEIRLFVGTYRNYSDHAITGSWQEVTYEYIATADETIEVGLRFYDQTGFDGAETVYVDDYTMTYTPSGAPTITVTPTSLSNLSYSVGHGPSSEQTFTVQGSDLTNDIILTAPTNFEISETSGSGYTSPITLTQSGGSVSETTIYVRLKSGLITGDYNEDITATSTGAITKTVSCSGAVEEAATTTIPYTKTFRNVLNPCYTYSVSGASKEWYWSNASVVAGGYAACNGYFTGNTEMEEDWLILPGINFDNYSEENMVFDSWYKYGTDDNNNYLDLYYSTNYSGLGDPYATGVSWSALTGWNKPSLAEIWTTSDNINLSSISGSMVYIAFKYHYEVGSYRSWGIDNISITGDEEVPVILSTFNATFANDLLTINWATESESNNLGWNIYRSISNNIGQAAQINPELIEGAGTTTEPTDYSYTDESEIENNTDYWYWLESASYGGETEVYGPVSLTVQFDEETPITPESYGLQQNYPNPFNPSTSISFTLAEESDVELIIYNIKGEKIKSIFNDHVDKNVTTISIWNGEDANGKQVSSGVYYYKLITDTKEYQKKMLLVK